MTLHYDDSVAALFLLHTKARGPRVWPCLSVISSSFLLLPSQLLTTNWICHLINCRRPQSGFRDGSEETDMTWKGILAKTNRERRGIKKRKPSARSKPGYWQERIKIRQITRNCFCPARELWVAWTGGRAERKGEKQRAKLRNGLSMALATVERGRNG